MILRCARGGGCAGRGGSAIWPGREVFPRWELFASRRFRRSGEVRCIVGEYWYILYLLVRFYASLGDRRYLWNAADDILRRLLVKLDISNSLITGSTTKSFRACVITIGSKGKGANDISRHRVNKMHS